MFRSTVLRFSVVCLVTLAGPVGLASTPDAIRATLFRDADAALAQANAERASIFAPISYSEGGSAYKEAESTLESGGAIDDIQEALAEATEAFRRSAAAAEVAKVTLPGAVAARADAISAEAARFSPEAWEEAEVAFANAVRRLENDSVNAAQRLGEQARVRYRDAELLAIKANYLDETRALLEQARDARAKRYAPKTLAKAEALLAEAEQALDTDRYDTDRPRGLAQEAKYEARHAIHLSQLGAAFRGRDVTFEDSQLAWEDSVRGVADQLDSPIDFANGHQAAADALVEMVADLQAELAQARAQAGDQQQHIAALEQEIGALETRLGGEAESLHMVNALLAAQERIRARIVQVEELFDEDQAVVLRKGDDVIIRMVGLNFDTGKATVKPEHHPLLALLRQAFALFPNSPVLIEGHTDSFGSDELNQRLSEDRAKAVEAYLTSVGAFDASRLSSVGHGETRPAANNETAEGRRTNRRIDVVIYRAGDPDG